jgi:hypothetical protein
MGYAALHYSEAKKVSETHNARKVVHAHVPPEIGLGGMNTVGFLVRNSHTLLTDPLLVIHLTSGGECGA